MSPQLGACSIEAYVARIRMYPYSGSQCETGNRAAPGCIHQSERKGQSGASTPGLYVDEPNRVCRMRYLEGFLSYSYHCFSTLYSAYIPNIEHSQFYYSIDQIKLSLRLAATASRQQGPLVHTLDALFLFVPKNLSHYVSSCTSRSSNAPF